MTLIGRLRQSGVRETASFSLRLGMVAVRRPREAADQLAMQLALTRSPKAAMPIAVTRDWRRVMHERIGGRWPCTEDAEFRRLWAAILAELPAVSSAVDHDADPTLGEVVWCLCRHLLPRVVVETGVSRGLTSRVILEALARNDEGHLWSIDLPPLRPPWRNLVGTAVPPTMRERWTYVRGSSRRRLPEAARRIGLIDLFVHDSLHTPDNLRFELATVWPHLRAGAGVVIDDAEECHAVEVLREFSPLPPLYASEERKPTSVGLTVAGAGQR